MLNIGIKYCGGCNPRYNRTEFVKKLETECKNCLFTPAVSGQRYDKLLVVCGCKSRCADYSTFDYTELTVISDEEEADEILQTLKNH